jgi:hypothetical protein
MHFAVDSTSVLEPEVEVAQKNNYYVPRRPGRPRTNPALKRLQILRHAHLAVFMDVEHPGDDWY